jgi:phosphatidylinositol alpha-1,6-mannosyltransferase
MHIGILAPDLSPLHGWGSYSLNLIMALRQRGASLSIVAARDCPPLEAHVQMLRLLPSVTRAPRGALLRLLATLPAARAALAGCDVIHAHVEPYAPLAAWLAGSRPLLITGHGTYVRMGSQRFPNGAVYRQAFRRGLLVCVSRYTESAAQAALPGVRTTVINNGVDAARYADIARRPSAQPVILTVGAVKPRKGVHHLVRALAHVRAHLPNTRLMVVGSLEVEPAYVAELRQIIASLALEEVVQLVGQVPEAALREYYATADVFALPSLNVGDSFEGYGLALMEASAAGLALIGSRDCGAEDAVDDGVTGLLVPQSDEDALADALTRLLSERGLAARMGQAGRAKAAAHTWDAVAGRYLDLMEAERNGLQRRLNG